MQSQESDRVTEPCPSGQHVHPCSALVRGVCRNGFPVTRGCLPGHVVGPSGQSKWHAATPLCCDENYVLSAASAAGCVGRSGVIGSDGRV